MKIEQEIARILEPLTSPETLAAALEDIGFAMPGLDDVLPAPIVDFVDQAQLLVWRIRAKADDLATREGGDNETLNDVLDLFHLARDAFAKVQILRDAVSDPGIDDFPQPFTEPEVWSALARDLPGYLLYRWVRRYHPLAFEITGALRLWKSGGYGLDLARVNQFASEPAETLRALVINEDTVDIANIVALAQRIGMLIGPRRPDRALYYVDGMTAEDIDVPRPPGLLAMSFLPPGIRDTARVDVGLDYDGTALSLALGLHGETARTLSLSDDWRLTAGASGDTGVAFRYAPDTGIEIDPDTPGADGTLSLLGRGARPWRLFGFDKGPQLTLDAMSLQAGASLTGTDPEFRLGLSFEALKLNIDMKDGDSFVAAAVPLQAFEVEFAAALDWSSVSGLNVTASGPSVITIPLNLSIGPVSVPSMKVGLEPMDAAFQVWLTVSASADLGFLRAVVENIGIKGTLSEAATGQGMLGDYDLSVGFKPPTGIGLSVGSPGGAIGGGGYLNVDRPAGRYEGIVDLQIVKIGITAIVIIDTEALESGAWSMFFALFIEMPSIQLGFGISLDGVGGVAGIHRTLDPEALLAATRSGALDNVLFPENPIRDAPMIIDTFRAMFPPAQGRYVFGPVVKLGWAKGTISAELGVVIELPAPVLVAVIGSISVTFPAIPESATDQLNDAVPAVAGDDEVEFAIVALRLDVAGVFDFEAGTIAIDAYLHDSTIAGFPISGGMSLRAGFKNDPKFLLALGGFHPGFPQPNDFPIVPRLAMGIQIASVIDISFECYFAVASNTVQFGSAIYLMADIEIFQIEGGYAFDALFEFDPFRVTIGVDMFVNVRAAGIDLMSVRVSGSVEGPKPWLISALVEVDIIGYRDGFSINRANGEAARTPAIPPLDVFQLLIAALGRDDAWDIIEGAETSVMLAEPAPDETRPGVSPGATIAVAQKIAPLGTPVDRHGQNTDIIHSEYNLGVELGGDPRFGGIQEWFAPGHFRDLGASDQAKLSAPSFEQMPAGKSISGPFQATAARAVSARHKTTRIDPVLGARHPEIPRPAQQMLEDHVAATALSDVLTTGKLDIARAEDVRPITLKTPQFISVDRATGKAAQAQSFMEASARHDAKSALLVRDFEAEAIR